MFIKEKNSDLVSLRLQSLENLFEAVHAGLTHPVQRVGSLDLAEVGRSVAARGIEDICLAEHILDHEILPLESNAFFILAHDSYTTFLQLPLEYALAFVNPAEQICQHLSGWINLKIVFT